MGGCVSSDGKESCQKHTAPGNDPVPAKRSFGTDISVNAKKPSATYQEVFKIGKNAAADKPVAKMLSTRAAVEPVRVTQTKNATRLSAPALSVSNRNNSNPQLCTDYVQEIMASFKAVEAQFVPGRYLENGVQDKLSSRGRCVVINWIAEAHRKFKLKHESLFLAVSIFDRFLAVRSVAKAKLQLVGACSLFIAAKWEELHPPRVRDFVHLAGKDVFSAADLIKMEVTILNSIKFDIGVPTPFRFVQHLLLSESDATVVQLTWFLAELSLFDYDLQQNKPSIISGSCALLALKMIKQDSAGAARIAAQAGYTPSALTFCMDAISRLHARVPDEAKSVIKKYSGHDKFCVAKLPTAQPSSGRAVQPSAQL